MMICLISGSLQETIGYRLRKSGFQVLHILDTQVIESSIRQFKPAMVLIASDSVAYDSMELLVTIKSRHTDLPVLTFSAPVDGFVDDMLSVVTNTFNKLRPQLPGPPGPDQEYPKPGRPVSLTRNP